MKTKQKTTKSRIKLVKTKIAKPVSTKRKKRGMLGFLKGKCIQLDPGDIFNLKS